MNIVFDDSNLVLKAELHDGEVYFHVEVKNYTPSLARHYKEIFEEILLSMLIEHEVVNVFSLIPPDKKVEKFNKSFGFEEVGRSSDWVLMTRGTL